MKYVFKTRELENQWSRYSYNPTIEKWVYVYYKKYRAQRFSELFEWLRGELEK